MEVNFSGEVKYTNKPVRIFEDHLYFVYVCHITLEVNNGKEDVCERKSPGELASDS